MQLVFDTATVSISDFYLQRINEKPQVINDYEAGRAIPNNQIMNKLERALGKLRFLLYILTMVVFILQ